ncbi:MlaD family protein [Mycolicibacter sinensis]|uniref:MlaD family protein n=1 Tax=Mycolicibacter sinensis (strain JDM601) TaxID=875328 RepID=UPI0013016BC8|nr:MlaD family protein [Mycolicibacter sinensis]
MTIQAPYVGQGVQTETPVIMHGVKIGEVTAIRSVPGGGVQMEATLDSGPTRGLTNTMKVDYRAANYFGITGINLTPGEGGQPLRSGMQLNITPEGNFSLQALLYRLGALTNGVFDERLIRVFERATRYVDGLNPLLETALIVGSALAKVQTVSTAQLLENTAGVSSALPSVIDAATSSADVLINSYYGMGHTPETSQRIKEKSKYYKIMDDKHKQRYDANERFWLANRDNDVFFDGQIVPQMDKARTDLFGRIGQLESSHVDDLFPLVESIRGLVDTVPEIFSPEDFAETVMDLRGRFERIYGSSPDQHSLQVRIVLDRLPGIAAPLGYAPGEPEPAQPQVPAASDAQDGEPLPIEQQPAQAGQPS